MLSTPPDSAIPDLLGPLHTHLWPIVSVFNIYKLNVFILVVLSASGYFKRGIFLSGITISHFKRLTRQNNKLYSAS